MPRRETATPPRPSGIVEDLRRPEAYPPPTPTTVDLAETHASWVFLTDDEVFKVKKPVDYGFLDYSTVSRRLEACTAEVRLGRRLAPDVYLGVVPVHRGDDGRLTFNDRGPVKDHAVHMRRLPDADSAISLLNAGRLERAHLAVAATTLAAFYRAAPRADAFGDPTVIARNVHDNFDQLRPVLAQFPGRFIEDNIFTTIERSQTAAVRALAPALAQRREAGLVRDGHGDLRLEHLYFAGGRPDATPVIIDAIEFNDSFRCQDQALDAAFLAMELDAQARPDLAAWFVARFAREAADFDLFRVLDLYMGYRAVVRAKVACLLATSPHIDPDKATRKAAEARRLFSLATTYADPQRPIPTVVAVGGLPAAGKSAVADALIPRWRIPAVSSDVTRKQMAGLALDTVGPASLYTPEVSHRTYDEMLRRAGEVLATGRGVIVDATFRKRADRAAARDLATRQGARFLFVEVRSPDDVMRARLQRRETGASVSDAREPQLEALRAEWEAADELPDDERIVASGTGDPDDAARTIAMNPAASWM